MSQLFTTMTPDNCATLAGIVPLFLIAQIAERFVSRGRRTFTGWTALVARGSAVLVATSGFAVLEIVFIAGMSNGGYVGAAAENWWSLFGALFVLVMITWAIGALVEIGIETWKAPLPKFVERWSRTSAHEPQQPVLAARRRARYRAARRR